ncbi:AMP-binding protein [Actibacterium sp. MT2.3-13A]|uniref:AMP-binding protein n=1 Tax=Actibacterium sp. MT2.3-13A TaxID=2828332 RepID=UPI001BABEA71|nr:AMP-binding protein [Actibacterium sp. MT2.3-13A]
MHNRRSQGDRDGAAGGGPGADLAAELMREVRKLGRDLHPDNDEIDRLGLDADLDARFGFDSLGRAELMARLERQFDVRLPDALRAGARTPRDILAALGRAEARVPRRPAAGAAPPAVAADRIRPVPEGIDSLTAVLDWHAEHHPDRPHIIPSDGDAEDAPITYAALAEGARALAGGLRARGLEPGESVAIMLPTGPDFFHAFMGALMAGGIPVPIYPPARPDQIEQSLRSSARILGNCRAALLLTVPEGRAFAGLLRAAVPTLRAVATVEELSAGGAERLPRGTAGGDICLLQYTSGSTGDPKGVILSHDNLLANIRAMGRAIGATPNDVYVSWLPLYHDMGLIGAWLSCLYFAAPTVIMSPLQFLARPERWLWTIHRNRGTVSAAPNFAYAICAGKIEEEALEGLDLGSWRFAANAAEPVSPATLRAFTDRFAPHGFRPEAMRPCYGLAESVTGLSFAAPGHPPWIDRIDREALAASGRAVPVGAGAAEATEIVACGRPLLGHEVRIVDAAGHELPERRQGRLQFRGPSATRGYFGNPEKTAALFDGDWLESGDLAYVAKGEIFITGRTKDVIIRAGRLIHPAPAEEAIGRIDGIIAGAVILFGVPDPAAGTERLVVLAESRSIDPRVRARLAGAARACSARVLGEAVDEVVIVPRHAIPKTSSGKLRRFQARENYLAGRPAGTRRPRWWQIARFALAGARGWLARFAAAARARAYANYWWAVTATLGGLLWPLVQVLPGLSLRWAVMRGAVRLALFLQGYRLEITAEAPPPDRDVVYVANHTSYLDSAALIAALPGNLAFVAFIGFREMRFRGPILRALGTLFVEQFETETALEHMRGVIAAARAGRPVVFYPEATIMRMPGLMEFRMGAFVTAAEAGVPVVPVTIRGCRSALRHDHRWFPHRVPLSVHIGRPIAPRGADFEAALALKNAARARILERCGEPDIAREEPRF